MNFIRQNILVIILVLFLLFCAAFWLYWHLKPFTDNAFVFANTRTVSPWVEGYVTDIFVRNNQFVKKGTPLFTVFSEPYFLNIQKLEHEKDNLASQLASCEEKWKKSLEEIKTFQADIDNYSYLYSRAKEMFKAAAISEDYLVGQNRNLQVSLARLAAAEHEANSLKHDCAALRAQIKKTDAALKLEQIWYQQTTVTALSDGYVVNMMISPGGYYKPGNILFAFIDSTEWFIQANFKESELSAIREGTRARIWIRQYPGKEYRGVVCGTSWSAERRLSSSSTGIAEVKNENEWFMLPQRYPVQIKITNPDKDIFRHLGASAYVELDIPSRPFRQFFWELFLWH
jgi:multidrug resistance efflux pump